MGYENLLNYIKFNYWSMVDFFSYFWYTFNMSKEKIIKKLEAKLPVLKNQYPIKELGIFGSIARGDDTEKSDVDILVEFNGPIGFFKFIGLEQDLSKLLGKKVDLVTKQALKPIIKEDVLKEVIYV